MEMKNALCLLEDINKCQSAVAAQFEPFKRHEHMQDYPEDARTIIRLMGLLADAQADTIQLLRRAK